MNPGKPKPPKRKNKERERKQLERRLETLVRLIVAWRDASQCVEHEIDGAKCNGIIQWGHILTRRNAPWLKYDLGNSACQCSAHNLIHDKNDMMMINWYVQTFGNEAFAILLNQQRANIGKRPDLSDLEYWIGVYGELYENRFYVDTDIESLVAGGYYGNAIRSAWLSAGRIKEWK